MLGTLYTFTVTASNCGDQQGEGNTFTVQPRCKTVMTIASGLLLLGVNLHLTIIIIIYAVIARGLTKASFVILFVIISAFSTSYS